MKQKIKQMVEKIKEWFKRRSRLEIILLIILAIAFAPTLFGALFTISSIAIPVVLIVGLYKLLRNKKENGKTNK